MVRPSTSVTSWNPPLENALVKNVKNVSNLTWLLSNFLTIFNGVKASTLEVHLMGVDPIGLSLPVRCSLFIDVTTQLVLDELLDFDFITYTEAINVTTVDRIDCTCRQRWIILLRRAYLRRTSLTLQSPLLDQTNTPMLLRWACSNLPFPQLGYPLRSLTLTFPIRVVHLQRNGVPSAMSVMIFSAW